MVSKLASLTLAFCIVSAGAARAADVPDAVQKTLNDNYALTCTMAMDPTDANFAAAFGLLTPDYVSIDPKGKQQTRDEVIGNAKQQLKTVHITACTNKFDSLSAPDASTAVVVNTVHYVGDIQTPDGKHDFDITAKAQDTWKLIAGKWLNAQGKDLHFLMKVDGNVVQDQGT